MFFLSGLDLKLLKIRVLRTILRGYQIIKNDDGLKRLNLTFESLSEQSCIANGYYSELIFGAAKTHGEILVRQFILSKLISRFGKAVLYSYGRKNQLIFFPLPPSWHQIIIGHGFKLDKILSKICWNAMVLFFLIYGYFYICKTAFLSVKNLIDNYRNRLGCYTFFDGLSGKNLPQEANNGNSHDIISWYLQWKDRAGNLHSICHTVPSRDYTISDHGIHVQSIGSPIPLPSSTWSVISFVAWGIASSIIATLDLLRGRWWHALILVEATKGALIRNSMSKRLARDYLFHNSNWIYRPLWTYDAEVKGSRIIFYFYSSNIQQFKRNDIDPYRAYYGYKAMTWPHYLVWDDYQEKFLKSIVKTRPKIDVVGPIWFSSSNASLPFMPNCTVAVFDVQPLRKALYNTLLIEFDYYTPFTVNKFLNDIFDVLVKFNCSMALKRKRNIGNLTHPSYTRELINLERHDAFVEVDPDLSAIKLIDKCMAVISLPFTSTALLARDAGKPSVYYDPHGILMKDDPAAHGIELIHCKDRLSEWLVTAVNESTTLLNGDATRSKFSLTDF